jgi:hypothetical protein
MPPLENNHITRASHNTAFHISNKIGFTLKRNESRLVRCADTRTSVPHRLVGDGEFSKVHADHFRLHFHTTEHLSVVDTNNTADHFRNNNHVTQVGLDTTRLFALRSFLLGLTQTLDQCHGLTLQTSGHATTCACTDQVHELIVGQVQECFELDTTKGELSELALLAQFGNLFSVHFYDKNRRGYLQITANNKRFLETG